MTSKHSARNGEILRAS
ncbi:MAG: hypothetical protein EZS28_049455, partial [Streblomastix strix]